MIDENILEFINEHGHTDVVTISSALDDINRNIAYLDNTKYTLGQEGILSIISRVLDGFIAVFNNIKASLMKFHKLVKRSELKYWIENNLTMAKMINKSSYVKFSNVDIPLIVGMRSKYPVFADVICNLIKETDMVTKANNTLSAIKKINESLSNRQPENISSGIVELQLLFQKDQAKNIAKKINSAIDLKAKRVEEVPFSDQFSSVKEFTLTVDQALSVATVYDDIQKLVKVVDKIEKEFDRIIDVLENNEMEIDKKDIKNLSKVAYDIAEVFEQYGSMVIVYNKLEHNLVEVYKTLKSNT